MKSYAEIDKKLEKDFHSPFPRLERLHNDSRRDLKGLIMQSEKGDLVRPSSYHIAMAQTLLSEESGVMGQENPWFDEMYCNCEYVHIENHRGAPGLDQWIDAFVVNAQTFSQDPRGIKVEDGVVDINSPEKYFDKTIMEGVAWIAEKNKLKEAKIPVLSLDQYNEAQKHPHFLMMTPSFIVVLNNHKFNDSCYESVKAPLFKKGRFSPEKRILENRIGHILSGTRKIWKDRLRSISERSEEGNHPIFKLNYFRGKRSFGAIPSVTQWDYTIGNFWDGFSKGEFVKGLKPESAEEIPYRECREKERVDKLIDKIKSVGKIHSSEASHSALLKDKLSKVCKKFRGKNTN